MRLSSVRVTFVERLRRGSNGDFVAGGAQKLLSGPRHAGTPASSRGRRTGTERDQGVLLSVGLVASAAMIHLSAAIDHAGQWWLYTPVFVVLATAQLTWAAAVLARPTQARLVVGLAVNAAVVLMWMISRTVGIPLGPEAWQPEPLGLLDAVATLDEVAILVLTTDALRRAPRGGPAPPAAFAFRGARSIAPYLISGSMILFVLGAHAQ
jgi:hypothetical protein